MEELKELVGMLKDIPNAAIIVLGGYLFYKLAIVGSVFGVVKLAITRLTGIFLDATDAKREKVKLESEASDRELSVESAKHAYKLLDRLTISSEIPNLMIELRRLTGIGTSSKSSYIHSSDIKWLRHAIDDRIAKESNK